jgi:autoinducer 2 (AI-2) kinase
MLKCGKKVSPNCVLAIDAGSSGCRALVFDLQGNVVSSAYQKWVYDIPAETAPLGRQFDPPTFWNIICRLISQAIRESALSPSDIIAVSTASQRQGVVFLDSDGNELYGGPNTDLRALAEGFSIDSEFGGDIYRITGHTPSFLFTPAKLRWFKAHHQHVYKQVAKVLSINNWVVYRLCGASVGELSSGADIGLVDIARSDWSTELLKMLDLPQRVCPDMASAGTCVGEVTRVAAAQSGLAQGTMVVVGGADTQCGLQGMVVNKEAQVGIVAGWSASIQMATAKPLIDPKGRIWSGCHVSPGRWILESNATESGGAYSWLKDLLYDDKASDAKGDTYATMDRLAQEVPIGVDGVLAFIGPRVMDMTRLRLDLGGFLFPIPPSVSGIERKHFIRAALESLCFAFKANCAQLEEISKFEVRRVSIGGGLTQSKSLVQMLSDVLGLPVRCFEDPQVTSYGVAMCAAVGAGVYQDLEAASEAMKPKSRLVEPDPQNAQQYMKYYQRWMHTAGWLENLVEEIG